MSGVIVMGDFVLWKRRKRGFRDWGFCELTPVSRPDLKVVSSIGI